MDPAKSSSLRRESLARQQGIGAGIEGPISCILIRYEGLLILHELLAPRRRIREGNVESLAKSKWVLGSIEHCDAATELLHASCLVFNCPSGLKHCDYAALTLFSN